jgi:hypothetical protein
MLYNPLPINLSHIYCIFFRVVYSNFEKALKVYMLSLSNVILDNYTHTTNKTQGRGPFWESNGSYSTTGVPWIMGKVIVHYRLHISPSLF